MSLFERFDQKICNMSTMLTRIGIDPAAFAQQNPGNFFVHSMRDCQFCPHGDRCSQWLRNADDRIEQVPEFCPNKRRFERARKMMRKDVAPN